MRSGQLNQLIDLQCQTKAPDGMGGFTVTWSIKASNIPAAIWPLKGDHLLEGLRLTTQVTHRIRIRYRSDVRTSWRIKYGDKYFSMSSIIDIDMRHKDLEIMAKETT